MLLDGFLQSWIGENKDRGGGERIEGGKREIESVWGVGFALSTLRNY